MSGDEKRARDRLLEISLREVAGGESPPDLLPRVRAAAEAGGGEGEERTIALRPNRSLRALWWVGVAAAVLVVVVILGVRTGGPDVDVIGADVIQGVVLDPDGREVAGVGVTLRIGWTENRGLAPLGPWLFAESRTTNADDTGRFRIAGVPEDGAGMLFASHEGRFGNARASAYPVIRLREPGSLSGRVVAAEDLRKRLRITFVSSHPGAVAWVSPREDGTYSIEKMPDGPGTLYVGLGNFVLHRQTVVVRSGRETAVEAIDIEDDDPEASPDPLVMAVKARLVDEDGAPVAGVRLIWSSPWGDGASPSDEDGVVRLAGGGVLIGPPPFFLRLSTVGGKYYGELSEVAGDTASVVLRPLTEVRLRVTRDGAPLDASLHFLAGKAPSRVYRVRKVENRLVLLAPPGRGRLVAVTRVGEILERELVVEKAPKPVSASVDFN